MKNQNYLLFQLSSIMGIILILFLSSCKKDVMNDDTIPQQNQEFVDFSLGCELLPATEYAKIQMAKTPDVILKVTSLNLNVPPIGNQGGEGSCVAFGTTYAARSINWQVNHTAAWSYSANIFSPEYVYNQIKLNASCGSGTYVTRGLNLLQSEGVCTWASMPYTDQSCSLIPDLTLKTLAATYKILSYSTVAINTTSIKSFLTIGKPIIVAGPVNSDFVNLKNNKVLSNFKGHSLGGHCYCVVGYDDTKSAFKFMNSWGTSWASAGFGYIAYSKIASWWSEAYVIN